MSQYEEHVFDAIYGRRSIRSFVEGQEPRTKYVEEAVYWQRYDSQREHRPRPGNLVVARAAREKR